jgi:Cu/Ag efflux protein CusF
VSKTFLIAVTCKITTQDKPEAALEDLKVGDKVKILYEQEKDGLIARRITLRGIDAEDREEARQKERLEHR